MKEKKVSKWMREHKMSIFVIVSAVVMLIGLSYAWLQITLRGEREINIFAAGSLQLELDDTMTNGIRVENAVPITDEEAVEAFEYLSRVEGIIPALESAHAIAHAMKIAPNMDKDKIIIINFCKHVREISYRE